MVLSFLTAIIVAIRYLVKNPRSLLTFKLSTIPETRYLLLAVDLIRTRTQRTRPFQWAVEPLFATGSTRVLAVADLAAVRPR